MDEQSKPTNTSSAPPQPVMDIQPKPSSPSPSVVVPTNTTVAPKESTDTSSTPETVEPAPTQADSPGSVAPAPAEDSTAQVTQSQPIAEPSQDASAPPTTAHDNTKPKKPFLVILVAVVIASVLISFAVFAYLKSQNSVAPEPANQQSSETDDKKADANDVQSSLDETTQEIDSINEDEDFQEGALSDETLGL